MSVALSHPVGTHDSRGGRQASEPVVCISNIGPAQQRKRLLFGLAALAAGIVLAVLLVWSGANPLYRVALFAPFAMAGVGCFQARDKT